MISPATEPARGRPWVMTSLRRLLVVSTLSLSMGCGDDGGGATPSETDGAATDGVGDGSGGPTSQGSGPTSDSQTGTDGAESGGECIDAADCEPGESQCDGELVQTCVDLGGGCFGWDSPVECDEGSVCGDGACQLVPGSAFESRASQWSVPDGGFSEARGFWGVADINGDEDEQTWSTLDLDGDGRLDLVVTGRGVPEAGGATAWGTNGSRHWRVYRGGDGGFAADASQWSVPDGGFNEARGFWGVADINGDEDEQTWSTIDLDGDGQLDLVVTARGVPEAGGATAWGTSGARHWRVYRGEDGGFASEASQWSVPDGGFNEARGFWGVADINGDADEQTWSTIDLDGDGRLDLVVTARGVPEAGGATTWGTSGARHWRVYRGEDGGFAAEPSQWSVPDGGLDEARGFWGVADINGDADEQTWSTIDLDGDGRLDLVVTGRGVPEAGGATAWGTSGSRHWRVYRGEDGGFSAEVSEWSVPDGGLDEARGFWGVADINGDADEQTWSTIDLDGDGRLDLVVTGRGVPEAGGATAWGASGSRHWRVYRGEDGGFSAEASEWSVPDGGFSEARGFWGVADINGDEDEQTWSTIDLNGDGRLDLVVTGRGVPEAGGATAWGNPGSRHWRLFAGTP